MTLSQRTIAEINAVLRRELGREFTGSITFDLGLSTSHCKVDIRHFIKLDPEAASLTLIDSERKVAVR